VGPPGSDECRLSSGRRLQHTDECGTHPFFAAIAAVLCDRFYAVGRFFQSPSCGVQANRLHSLCRSPPTLLDIRAGEIPRAHIHPFRERANSQIRFEMLRYPAFKLCEAIRFRLRLGGEQSAGL